MIEKAFHPSLNKVYVFKKHSVLILKRGQGLFQADFRNYHFSSGKALFLAPGQYFQLLSGHYDIQLFEFPGDKISQTLNARFLFKHLISLGHIDLSQQKQFHLNPLQYLDVSASTPEILSNAITTWISQNPFKASQQEVNLLFDLKDIVDEKFREPISMPYLSKALQEKPYHIRRVTKEKLNSTVSKLAQTKLLLEAQRKVIFSDWTTKEIAYELGFNDPTYFNRFFKLHTHKTPHEFREDYSYDERDTFVQDVLQLIDTHFKQQRAAAFYADQLCISAKTLAKKINQKLGTTLHQLIKDKILNEAKSMLQNGLPVNAIAFELGFQEPNHFSAFFKTHTGQTPTTFVDDFQKVHSLENIL